MKRAIVSILVAFGLIMGVTACDPTSPAPLVGSTSLPRAIVVSTNDPTTDQLQDYRRSITVTSEASFTSLITLAWDSDYFGSGEFPIQCFAAVYSKEALDADPTHWQENLNEIQANAWMNSIALGYYIFIDTDIPTVQRQAMYNWIADLNAGSTDNYLNYAVYSGDPANELKTKFDLCYGEGA